MENMTLIRKQLTAMLLTQGDNKVLNRLEDLVR